MQNIEDHTSHLSQFVLIDLLQMSKFCIFLRLKVYVDEHVTVNVLNWPINNQHQHIIRCWLIVVNLTDQQVIGTIVS